MNKHLIVSSAIIIGIGFLNAVAYDRSVNRVVIGGLTTVLLLSILESLGPTELQPLISALANLSAVTAVMVELPDLLHALDIQTREPVPSKF